MMGMLNKMAEMVGKWHLVERTVGVDGEYFKFTQDRDVMLVETIHGEPYARLSCRIPGQPAPEGWFWLRNWSENAEFWEKVAHHFEVGNKTVQVSPHVETVAARFLLHGYLKGESDDK
jgi:hypothetical protein